MGCQRAIAEKIVTKGADYILAVKDNQPQLHEVLGDYFETAQAANFEQVPVSYFEETDAGHGRCEVRRHWLVKDLSTLPEPENWTKLQSIGMVESERHEGEKTSREHRYYITTLAEDAEVFGNAVRAHWGVENQLHWTLDVVFRELLHEKSLVDGMQIEPETFAIRLTDPNGRKVAPDRLSAGERQLLAVAILWGLAKASGRSLSIVIDTPMGRLDSAHRSNLVERFFRAAGHQVLLLSTDEAVDQRFFHKLSPKIGRSYRLDYSNTNGATEV